MAAVRPNAQVELDLLRRSREQIADGHDPAAEIDRLGLVLEEEPDVRDEERLFHELLVEERATYGIDRLFVTAKWAMGAGQFLFSLFDPSLSRLCARTELACLCGSYCRPLELPSFM